MEPKNTSLRTAQRKRRIRALLINTAAVVGAISLFGLMGFVNKKYKNTVCRTIDIQIAPSEGSFFIHENDIKKIIATAPDRIIGEKIDAVNIADIYTRIMSLSFIRKANVYTTVDGRCIIYIEQRKPIARILNADGSGFYLDQEGYTIPLSRHHTAHVPVFTGFLYEKIAAVSVSSTFSDNPQHPTTLLPDIYTFVQFLQENPFLQAQVEHVFIDPQKNFEIIPRVGNHRIVIGKIENLDQKFKKLMAFYAHTIHTGDINIYRKIRLEFDGQVVCVK